jgi:CheY-like chemotaxis protein
VLLRARPEWEICGQASDGKQAIEAVQQLKPDVVILEATMPTMSGLQAARQIAKLDKDCRISIFTMHESDRLAKDGRTAGAPGYLQKPQAGRDVIVAIDALLAGGTFFGGKGTKKSPQGDIPPGISFCWASCCNWMRAETYLLTLTPITRGRPGAHTVAKQLASLKFGSGYILLRPSIDQGLLRPRLYPNSGFVDLA